MARKLSVVALFLVFGCMAALAADFNGKWKADFSTVAGPLKYVFEFHVDGTKLTGKAISNLHGETEIIDGKVDGDSISFTEVADGPNGSQVKISYAGKIDGDEIRFTRKFGPYHTEEIVAERIKEHADLKAEEQVYPACADRSR